MKPWIQFPRTNCYKVKTLHHLSTDADMRDTGALMVLGDWDVCESSSVDELEEKSFSVRTPPLPSACQSSWGPHPSYHRHVWRISIRDAATIPNLLIANTHLSTFPPFLCSFPVFVNLTARKTKADTSRRRSEIFSTFRFAICCTTSKFDPQKCSSERDSRSCLTNMNIWRLFRDTARAGLISPRTQPIDLSVAWRNGSLSYNLSRG